MMERERKKVSGPIQIKIKGKKKNLKKKKGRKNESRKEGFCID